MPVMMPGLTVRSRARIDGADGDAGSWGGRHYKPALRPLFADETGSFSVHGQDDFEPGSFIGLCGEPDVAAVALNDGFG